MYSPPTQKQNNNNNYNNNKKQQQQQNKHTNLAYRKGVFLFLPQNSNWTTLIINFFKTIYYLQYNYAKHFLLFISYLDTHFYIYCNNLLNLFAALKVINFLRRY